MCIVSFCSLFNWFFFGRIAEYWLGLWGLPIYYVLQNWVVNPTQSGQPKSATGPIMLPSLIFFGVSYMNSFSIYLYQVSFLLLFLATSLSYFTASIYVLSCGLPINHSLICLAHTQPISNWPPLSKLCWVWFFFFFSHLMNALNFFLYLLRLLLLVLLKVLISAILIIFKGKTLGTCH